MYCENCGKNYANVKYTQVINGNRREMFLCEECSKILGIDKLSLPMDFSTFLSDYFTSFEEEIPKLFETRQLRCKRCNSTFDDFIKTGKFGCENCYSTFEEKIDPLLKSIQGDNRHVGRLGKVSEEMLNNNDEKEIIKENYKLGQINELKRQLKIAIKEEKYEDAASLRDKIKELEGEN